MDYKSTSMRCTYCGGSNFNFPDQYLLRIPGRQVVITCRDCNGENHATAIGPYVPSASYSGEHGGPDEVIFSDWPIMFYHNNKESTKFNRQKYAHVPLTLSLEIIQEGKKENKFLRFLKNFYDSI